MTTRESPEKLIRPPIVPLPAELTRRPGHLALGADARIGASGEAREAAWALHDLLRAGAGLRTPVVGGDDPAATVRLRVDPARGGHPEGYGLDVTESGVDLEAATSAGLARAVQTLRQLLPPDALRAAPIEPGPVTVPCCAISDQPAYDWRGVHIDVVRHWMPKEFLLRLVDLAALHRLNVVHLHLTDDQGWRFPVPGWPRLTEAGAWRTETVRGHALEPRGYDGTPHGGYYTPADLREVVAYATERGITVVPEIDLPGHVRAVLAAYPELGCTDLPAKPGTAGVATTFGVFEQVLAPTDEALRFARDAVDAVCDIFPGPYVHLGGDECPRTQWRESALARRRADELGLGSVDEIQSWFLRRLAAHVHERGRRAVGWDEVIDDGGMPKDTVVMGWRAAEYGGGALASGHDVVMCPQERTYLDHYQSTAPEEPLGLGGLTTLESLLTWDPAPAADPAGDAAGAGEGGRLLGVQAQLWSEYLPTPKHVEYMAFPRLAALAEVGWTSARRRESDDLRSRLPAHLERLDALGVTYRPLEGPRPWQRGGVGDRRRHAAGAEDAEEGEAG